ncbi:MAG TPA: NAD(+) diphosphatase [Thermoanaerobaculia bacterium]|nr:NAD(+) diphosphatase [Thermoanaerobaculia bacterium]
MSEDESRAGWWFAFRGSELLVTTGESSARVPGSADWKELKLPGSGLLDVGTLRGVPAWGLGLPPDAAPPEGFSFLGLRALWGKLDEETWRLAGRAVQLVEWDRNHQYCGRCATPTQRQTGELSRVCPQCGLHHFPRISPAVIVRIERGDEILLARSPHFAPGVYSTIAGFVEPGESLEETVLREVKEEVGVTVTNLRYFGSQPWPFPNSLMVGFVADYESGELVLQPGEIEDAGWFTVNTLPSLPSPLSIARALIDDFIRRQTS